jgi:peptidoglycan/LPS O-acetylase OafA/YrhL
VRQVGELRPSARIAVRDTAVEEGVEAAGPSRPGLAPSSTAASDFTPVSDRAARDASLDGLRGIAALWVFATHATYAGLLPPLLNFNGAGRGGVILFFFLSAFLLSGPFLRNLDRARSWREWAAYAIRRVCRIVPLYYGVVLVVFVLGFYPFGETTALPVLFRHLAFQEGRGVFWTIVVEMRFYVVLPVLLGLTALAIRRIPGGRLLVLLVGAAWLAGAARGILGRGPLLELGIGAHAPIFVAGVFAAFVANELGARRPGRGAGIALECLTWLAAITFVCLSVPAVYHAITTGASIASYSKTSVEYEAFWDVRIPWIGLILGCLFVALPRGTGLLGRALSWRPLAWVGRISFGVYLIHLNVIRASARTGLPPTARLLLAGLTTLALAALLHRLVEAPGIAAARRITSGLRERRA